MRIFVYKDNKLEELKSTDWIADIYLGKVVRIYRIENNNYNTKRKIIDPMYVIYDDGKKELVNGYIPNDILAKIIL